MKGAKAERCERVSLVQPGSQSGALDCSSAVIAACWEQEGSRVKAWSERAVLV